MLCSRSATQCFRLRRRLDGEQRGELWRFTNSGQHALTQYATSAIPLLKTQYEGHTSQRYWDTRANKRAESAGAPKITAIIEVRVVESQS